MSSDWLWPPRCRPALRLGVGRQGHSDPHPLLTSSAGLLCAQQDHEAPFGIGKAAHWLGSLGIGTAGGCPGWRAPPPALPCATPQMPAQHLRRLPVDPLGISRVWSAHSTGLIEHGYGRLCPGLAGTCCAARSGRLPRLAACVSTVVKPVHGAPRLHGS